MGQAPHRLLYLHGVGVEVVSLGGGVVHWASSAVPAPGARVDLLVDDTAKI